MQRSSHTKEAFAISAIDVPLTVVAATLGGLAVALGAFGAHALRDRLDAAHRATYETAVHYQMFHALTALVLGTAGIAPIGGSAVWAGWLFIAGIATFSGSLYALSLRPLRALGPVTPLGGFLFLTGWAVLVLGALHA